MIARSTQSDKTIFDKDFSEMPSPLPAPVWKTFLNTPMPVPVEFWIQKDGTKTVARVGASLSVRDPLIGFVGFFECELTHISKGEEILRMAVDYLKSKGAKRIIGPVNFNTWFPYRFRVGPLDSLKFSWEPTNPLEYVDMFKRVGFKTLELYTSIGYELPPFIEYTKPAYDKAQSLGYKFRSFDGSKLLDQEVPILYRLSMEAFQKNFLFEPIPYEAFKSLYVPIANKIDVSLAQFVLDPSGKEVAFCFNYEDQGHLVYKSFAVSNSARGLGLSNAFSYAAGILAAERGIQKFIAAMVKAGAQSESYGRHTKELWRHDYALFEKE